MLEMDLIDKDKIEREVSDLNEDVVTNMKNANPDALDFKEQIELVRRQLVLSELGIDIPKLADGSPDIKAIMKLKITAKDEEAEHKVALHWSPLMSEKPTNSIRKDIEPLFPMKTHINYREDLEIDDSKVFFDQIKRVLL